MQSSMVLLPHVARYFLNVLSRGIFAFLRLRFSDTPFSSEWLRFPGPQLATEAIVIHQHLVLPQ